MRPLLAVLIIYSTVFSDSFWVKEYSKAKQLAQTSGKPVMVESMREGCYYCRVMDETIFNDPEAQRLIRQRVIPFRVNLSNERLPEGLSTRVTPSFFFLDAKGQVVKKLIGGWTREDFLDIIATIGE